jgi:hypothetical protein
MPMRSKALSCAIKNIYEMFGIPSQIPPIYTDDQKYTIPNDGSKIIVIHTRRQPISISTYEVYSEPGNPIIGADYKSLEDFAIGFFAVTTRSIANQIAGKDSEFPSKNSLLYSKAQMDKFLKIQSEIEHYLTSTIKNKINSKKYRVIERYIFRSHTPHKSII